MSDSSEKQLTNDSDLYEDMMRVRSVNKESCESQIVDILDARYEYEYHCKASWASLTEEHTIDSCTVENIKLLNNMDKRELASKMGKRGFNDWTAHGKLRLKLELKLKIELPSKENKKMNTKIILSDRNDYKKISELLSAIQNTQYVDIAVNDTDDCRLRTKDYEFQMKTAEMYDNDILVTNDGIQTVLNYLEQDTTWVSATVQAPKEEEDSITVPISFEDNTIQFTYENPDTNKRFWSLVETIASGDPLLLEDTDIHLANKAVVNESTDTLEEDGPWARRETNPQESLSWRLRNSLPFL